MEQLTSFLKEIFLEEALEFIQEDEYVEITPKALRLRKIILDDNDRKSKQKAESVME